MAQDQIDRPKQIVNQLSEQGYSKTATKAIRHWYTTSKNA
jgi:hypothetical protein